jgi:hypothetical protein
MGASNHFVVLAGLTARAFLARVVVTVVASGMLLAVAAAPSAGRGLTALAVQAAGAPRYVLGSDRRLHIEYDLVITNALDVEAKLKSLVVTARGRRILRLEGNALAAHTHQVSGIGAGGTLTVPASSTVVTLVDAVLPRSAARHLPERLANKIGYAVPAKTPLRVLIGSFTVAAPILRMGSRAPAVIAPPVRGSAWFDANGCCDPSLPHRSALLPANGTYVAFEMFAIDWIREVRGVYFDGAGTKLSDYKSFGARIHAVAQGTVTSIENKRPEAPINQSTIGNPTVTKPDHVSGNNVIEKIGPASYAVYAHLRPGSVRVRLGQRVRNGQVIGLLGNSGNSTFPHLHFSIQDGPDPLTSNSLPFVLDHYTFEGTIGPGATPGTVVVTGRSHQELQSYPLSDAVADFSR